MFGIAEQKYEGSLIFPLPLLHVLNFKGILFLKFRNFITVYIILILRYGMPFQHVVPILIWFFFNRIFKYLFVHLLLNSIYDYIAYFFWLSYINISFCILTLHFHSFYFVLLIPVVHVPYIFSAVFIFYTASNFTFISIVF